MKLPLSWLSAWIDLTAGAGELAHQLTMLGLEVESVESVGLPLDKLVVGKVLETAPHPNADRLTLCRVDVGAAEPIGIVCGARNVRVGGLYAVALPGASLPGGPVIKASRIRGESSAGMLCSASELGLEAEADGLLELDSGAVPGSDASAALGLGDTVFDINITPNRADCFSVVGVSREIGALEARPSRELLASPVVPVHHRTLSVSVQDGADCPRFLGRIIQGIRLETRTPLWMRERLRRCGVRPIHPVVDVTNYVMLELGQPLHAYDLGRLSGGIQVRRARAGEALELLDGQTVRPGAEVLVIADDSGAIGLAGIMGGVSTAVSATTSDVFIECAWFAPSSVAGRARAFGLHTDASVRFERGVDPQLQVAAMEYATGLLCAIAGGEPGPISVVESLGDMPVRPAVHLRRARLARVLGTRLADGEVTAILGRLRMGVEITDEGWQVTPPTARFDVEREEDLVEEVARVHGYERIPAIPGDAIAVPFAAGETAGAVAHAGAVLMARGYQEAITYSFISTDMDRLFGAAEAPALVLSNPISAEHAAMRQSIWPGLALAARENLRRQQERVRMFEIGPRFAIDDAGHVAEHRCLAAVALGGRLPEQWGSAAVGVDFHDVKADTEALLDALGWRGRTRFEPGRHAALYPGRSARVLVAERPVGWLGELHPGLALALEMPVAILLEIDLAPLLKVAPVGYRPISVFPSVRRDIAVVVERGLPSAELLAAIRAAGGPALREAFVFDIYTGPQVGAEEKSVAMGLILQDPSRTLTDEEASDVLANVRSALSRQFKARIRE